jgi:hypothetical protein
VNDDLANLVWRKSTRSNNSNNCVEVADLPGGGKAVRNSRHKDAAVLSFTDGEWEAFIGGAKDGEFDA